MSLCYKALNGFIVFANIGSGAGAAKMFSPDRKSRPRPIGSGSVALAL
jgi:hypothetical protein